MDNILETINETLVVTSIVKDDGAVAVVEIAREQFDKCVGRNPIYPSFNAGKDENGMNVRIFNFNGVQLDSYYDSDRTSATYGTQFVLPSAEAKKLYKPLATFKAGYNTSILLQPKPKAVRPTIVRTR